MIRLPIITISEGDIDVFKSAERLAGYAEAIDVEGGVWNAWDSDGRRLTIRVESRPYKSFLGRMRDREAVVVEETVGAQPNDPALDPLILARLTAYQLPDPGDRRGSDLIAFVVAHLPPT